MNDNDDQEKTSGSITMRGEATLTRSESGKELVLEVDGPGTTYVRVISSDATAKHYVFRDITDGTDMVVQVQWFPHQRNSRPAG